MSSLFIEQMSDDDNKAFLEYVSEKVNSHVRRDGDGDPMPATVDYLRIILKQAVRAFEVPGDIREFFIRASSIENYQDARSYLAHIEALSEFGVLQEARLRSKAVFSSVEIIPSYKEKIRDYVSEIKAIVDRSGWAIERRDSLHVKLNVFLRDLDLDRTRLTALTAAFVQTSGAVGEAAEKLEPAVALFERIMKAIGVGSKENPGLPGVDQQRLLAPPENEEEV